MPAFRNLAIGIHHVGSTAVPGLAAKPEIDILIVVRDQNAADNCLQAMADLGYRRGDLSAGHSFFKRDVEAVRTHKVHVCLEGHLQIARMLRFRDLLQENETLRNEYQTLKLKLEAENISGIAEYLAAKAPFIETVLWRLR